MKINLFIVSLVSVLCSSISLASDQHVIGSASESALGSGCGSIDRSGIDFKRGETSVQQSAEAQCHGKADRISPLRLVSQCYQRRHVWNMSVTTVDFSADFECE